MRIAIIGAGGVGGYFGAKLALGGHDVHFVARGKHLAAMRDGGLRVQSAAGDFAVASPQATDDASTIGAVDVVLVAVKLWDTEAAARSALPLLGPDTAVVSLQNSVRKDDVLAALLPPSALVGGVAYIGAQIAEPGVIRHVGSMAKLVFGEFDGQRTPRVEALLAACRGSGIDADIPGDIRRALWEKFVFLASLAGVTSAIRKPIGPIRENARTRALFLEAMREVAAVADAEGVTLAPDFAATRLAFADTLPPTMTSSMHGDLDHGYRLEVEWLSGDVVARGERLGVATPVHRVLRDVLTLYEG